MPMRRGVGITIHPNRLAAGSRKTAIDIPTVQYSAQSHLACSAIDVQAHSVVAKTAFVKVSMSLHFFQAYRRRMGRRRPAESQTQTPPLAFASAAAIGQ